MKIIIDIDDSRFSSSKLELQTLESDGLNVIEFIPKLQIGNCDKFYIYPNDIDEIIEFLKQAKLLLV